MHIVVETSPDGGFQADAHLAVELLAQRWQLEEVAWPTELESNFWMSDPKDTPLARRFTFGGAGRNAVCEQLLVWREPDYRWKLFASSMRPTLGHAKSVGLLSIRGDAKPCRVSLSSTGSGAWLYQGELTAGMYLMHQLDIPRLLVSLLTPHRVAALPLDRDGFQVKQIVNLITEECLALVNQ